MKILIKYELRRIWNGKLIKLSLAGCCLFILFCVYSSIAQISTIDEKGTYITGTEAIEVLKDNRKEQFLDDNRVDSIIKEYLGYVKNPETSSSDEKYNYLSNEMYSTYYLKNRELLSLISSNFMVFGEKMNFKESFEAGSGKSFYETRTERTENWLDIKVNQGLLKEGRGAIG